MLSEGSLPFSTRFPSCGARRGRGSGGQSSKMESTGLEKQCGSWNESKGWILGSGDQRLNYADYSFVPCRLHLPGCLLGSTERRAHTICTQIHKSTMRKYAHQLPHHITHVVNDMYVCSQGRVYIFQMQTHLEAQEVLQKLMCP